MTRLRSWRRRALRLADEARFRRFEPAMHHSFFIVSAAYQAAPWVERHLESVRTQRYPSARITHLVIDDASPDATVDTAERYGARFPEYRLTVQRNPVNRGGCANLTRGFRAAPPGSIVLQVDADDWLADREVLAYLNMVFQDPQVWMTYNTWVFPDGRRGVNCEPIATDVAAARRFRQAGWISSHLHAFRAELFAQVPDAQMVDPDTGDFWRSAVDMAQYFPMLELAGPHARHLDRPLYVYNLHQGSIISSRRAEQLACEQRIRAMPPLPVLASLPSPSSEASSHGQARP